MKDLPSSYEPLHYGTSKWAKAKGNRNVVESYNSVEQFHRRVHKHSIRVRAHKWDFMHALLNAAIFIKTFYNWLIRLGAWAIEDYHPLDMPVVRKCMQLVSTPATSPPPSP
jgi:predicted Co/Zn/Cd cation transporter (cation efflux family)